MRPPKTNHLFHYRALGYKWRYRHLFYKKLAIKQNLIWLEHCALLRNQDNTLSTELQWKSVAHPFLLLSLSNSCHVRHLEITAMLLQLVYLMSSFIIISGDHWHQSSICDVKTKQPKLSHFLRTKWWPKPSLTKVVSWHWSSLTSSTYNKLL